MIHVEFLEQENEKCLRLTHRITWKARDVILLSHPCLPGPARLCLLVLVVVVLLLFECFKTKLREPPTNHNVDKQVTTTTTTTTLLRWAWTTTHLTLISWWWSKSHDVLKRHDVHNNTVGPRQGSFFIFCSGERFSFGLTPVDSEWYPSRTMGDNNDNLPGLDSNRPTSSPTTTTATTTTTETSTPKPSWCAWCHQLAYVKNDCSSHSMKSTVGANDRPWTSSWSVGWFLVGAN